MSDRYTTFGSVRGGCYHAHKTARQALRCLERDREGCERQGGYSDRELRRIAHPTDARSYALPDGPGEGGVRYCGCGRVLREYDRAGVCACCDSVL